MIQCHTATASSINLVDVTTLEFYISYHYNSSPKPEQIWDLAQS